MAEVRYFLDEHVAQAVASGLRLRRIDVQTVADASMRGADDATLRALVLESGCVLVTQDADFLQLASSGVAHSGIVCAPMHRSVGDFVRTLVLIHSALKTEDLIGRVEYA